MIDRCFPIIHSSITKRKITRINVIIKSTISIVIPARKLVNRWNIQNIYDHDKMLFRKSKTIAKFPVMSH